MAIIALGAGLHSGLTISGGDTAELAAGGTLLDALISPLAMDIVSAGAVASGTLLGGQGREWVFGSAISTHVDSTSDAANPAIQVVEAGGYTSASTIDYAGSQSIAGSAWATTLGGLGGGFATVFSGGLASGMLVISAGVLTISSGGSAAGLGVGFSGLASAAASGGASLVTVSSGGEFVAVSGGTVSGITVLGGGLVVADNSGLVHGATVESGGTIQLFSGGTDYAASIQSGAVELVFSGGIASGTVLASSGAAQGVYHGGVASGATLSSGGNQTVLGSAVGDIVGNGGVVNVYASGVASGASVYAGGRLIDAGAALATVVSGGTVSVTSTGTLTGAQVLSGGTMYVSSAGHVGGVALAGAGTLGKVFATGVASGGSVAASALLSAYNGATLEGTTIAAGGVVSMASNATGSGIVFAGGLLVLAGTVNNAGTLSGFGLGDTIQISGLAYSAGQSTLGLVGNALTVTEGATSEVLTLDATGLVLANFQASNDITGGTDITYQCFRAGTRIATPAGEAEVQTLRAGDLVRLAGGGVAPVRWVGRQTVARRFADPLRAQPVRIAAGALGEGLPARDLLLSPGHALALDGVLAQAGALENGGTIARAPMPERFEYWHIELDAHALLLAEGVAVESWLPAAEDVAFDNRAERPPREPPPELALPRVKAARQVPRALKARIARRAARLGATQAA
jgi:autotransporter passenger strand-loop-strand repeat protein